VKDESAVAAAAAALAAADRPIDAAPDSASLDASLETDRLSQLASSLGSALKRVGEEEVADDADEEVKGDDGDAAATGAAAAVAAGPATAQSAGAASKSSPIFNTAAGASAKTASAEAEDVDLGEEGGSDAVARAVDPAADPSPSGVDDWDVIDAASSANPLPSSSSSSYGSSGSSPGSIYTSPFCTLVLPIGTVYGTLEISALALKFTFNPHAEQQLLQQQLIATEQMAKQHAAENNGARFHAPPPKPKPFTLPSLDAWRARSRKDRVWPLGTLVAVYRRRYQLQKTALELFFLNGRNYFIDCGSRAERKTVLRKILAMRPPRLIRLCSRSVGELLSRSRLTEKWLNREMSNYEYLMHINTCSGRTYNDINQYPVFPWIISYYPETKVKLVPSSSKTSSSSSSSSSSSGAGGSSNGGSAVVAALAAGTVEVQEDLSDNIDIEEVIRAGPSHPLTKRVFRDLTKPMGALEPNRLNQVLEVGLPSARQHRHFMIQRSMVSSVPLCLSVVRRSQRFSTFFDSAIPPFHYGSHVRS
jgi:hypothetical protein